MSRTTYAEIRHRLVDVTAKAEAVYSMADKLPQSSYADIKDDDTAVDSIPTFEHNCWLLDGSMPLIPSDPEELTWGLWSNSMSDADGDFATNPELEITFTGAHTSSGLTFVFAGDAYPRQLAITWRYDSTELATETFTVDSSTYFAKELVEGFNAVTVEFIGTSVPYRRIKLAEIDYGELKVWGRAALISASVLEEGSPTSDEITINTLDFSVHDEAQEFNMLNPEGVYVALQQKQLLTVRGYVNGEAVPLGKYYLDTWENTSAVVANFTAYDAVGLFDLITYKTSAMWNGVAAGTVFASVFAAAGWTDYTVDADIAPELVRGYIPAVTVREALHQLCFSLRCSCIPNRSGTVEVKRLPSSAPPNAIEKSQKMGSQKITQNALVNSVLVTAYAFAAAGSSTQLYSADLEPGTYDITFSAPATGLSCSGGTITASGINYATVTVTTAGTVTVTGYQYESQTTTYLYEADGLTDATRSQVTVDSIYLISPANAAALAHSLYEDYQRRIVQSFQLALVDEAVGDNVDVDTMLGARKTGVITKLDINLTGGLIADVEVRG